MLALTLYPLFIFFSYLSSKNILITKKTFSLSMKLKEVNGRREGSDCGTPRKVVSQKDAGSS